MEEVLAFLEEVRPRACRGRKLQRADARRCETGIELRWRSEYQAAAAKLTAAGRKPRASLPKRVERELASLAMEKTRVEIRVEPAPWSEHGADTVAILISPNPGEEPKPLEKIASGGELSRVALALKTCTAPAKASGSAAHFGVR